MTCYIRNDRKKRGTLARNERELGRVLRQGGNEREVTEAAEAVRASKVRVLNLERARILPSSDLSYAARYEEINDKIARQLSMPLETIVTECRRMLARSRAIDADPRQSQ